MWVSRFWSFYQFVPSLPYGWPILIFVIIYFLVLFHVWICFTYFFFIYKIIIGLFFFYGNFIKYGRKIKSLIIYQCVLKLKKYIYVRAYYLELLKLYTLGLWSNGPIRGWPNKGHNGKGIRGRDKDCIW